MYRAVPTTVLPLCCRVLDPTGPWTLCLWISICIWRGVAVPVGEADHEADGARVRENDVDVSEHIMMASMDPCMDLGNVLGRE